MASYRNAAQIYGQNKIATATPAELTLMLYEGAIKFCNKAIEAVNKQEVEKAYENIVKVENIIVEFKATLNHNYEVAKDFDIVYDYIYDRLVAANMSKDPEILEEVLTQLRDMRDNWKTIMQSSVRR
ncbi:MAG: flagellar export chaperone FliS [Lachnospiraceae bacterium]|nr:flagellar export chaperone FliS [Lachnospiraceae bacterium]